LKGAKLKAELLEEFLTPPGDLLALDRATLDALDRALGKLPAGPHADER
jgi:hypothetical protein